MLSKQEQFAKKTIERLYGFADPDYQLYNTYGRHAKPDMLSIAALSKQGCIKDGSKFLDILDLIKKYCACDSADTQTLQAEEDLLKTIVQMLDEYVIEAEKRLKNLEEKSSRIFGSISDQDKKSAEIRKKDLQYVISTAGITNMFNTTACFKMYFDGLMYGLLPADPLPYSETNIGTGFEASDVPVFVHEPISQDIPANKTGPFFDGLRTLAETDALFIKSMIRDCGNGKIFVRLFDPDDAFNQEFIEVEKIDSFYQWIINDEGYCNWPGYIIAALQLKGLDTESDIKELFARILGKKVEEIDISDYCTFSGDRIVSPKDTNEVKILSGYKNCGLMLLASLLATNSNMIEDAEQYMHLRDALEEFTACFSLSAANKQTRDAAMNLLKQHSDKFRSQAVPGGKRMNKRILACDIIDSLFEIYSNRPDENPYTIIREQYPQLFNQ